MERRPLCLSREAFLHKRRKARTRKNKTEAPEDEETETDLHEGTEKIKIDFQREKVTSWTAWVDPPQQFTPLTTLVSQVLYEVQHEKFLRWPSQMRTDPAKRDTTKYFEFHRDHEYRKDDCIQLKKEKSNP